MYPYHNYNNINVMYPRPMMPYTSYVYPPMQQHYSQIPAALPFRIIPPVINPHVLNAGQIPGATYHIPLPSQSMPIPMQSNRVAMAGIPIINAIPQPSAPPPVSSAPPVLNNPPRIVPQGGITHVYRNNFHGQPIYHPWPNAQAAYGERIRQGFQQTHTIGEIFQAVTQSRAFLEAASTLIRSAPSNGAPPNFTFSIYKHVVSGQLGIRMRAGTQERLFEQHSEVFQDIARDVYRTLHPGVYSLEDKAPQGTDILSSYVTATVSVAQRAQNQ